jgi:hypothetical protein
MTDNAGKTYVNKLPNDVAVKLSVEKVFKRDEQDNAFSIECRICDGELVGNLITLYFYRNKLAGGPRKDTAQLLEKLNPGKKAENIPSYLLQGKIFETTPWHPESSRFQMFGRFKYIGTNDVF